MTREEAIKILGSKIEGVETDDELIVALEVIGTEPVVTDEYRDKYEEINGKYTKLVEDNDKLRAKYRNTLLTGSNNGDVVGTTTLEEVEISAEDITVDDIDFFANREVDGSLLSGMNE